MYIHFARGEKTKTQMKATLLHEALEWPSRWHTLCVWSESKNVEEKKKVRPGWSMVWHTQKKNATQGTRLPINIQETSVKALTSILHRQPQDCQTHLKIRATFSSFIDVPSTSLSTFSIHFLEETSKIPTKILLSTGSQGELSTGIYEHLFY